MATTYRIHPAIGIARVGNSPDEFFIGPERVRELPDPPGGFKDALGRVKRQAARFRIFAHHDDGTYDEVTDAVAQITWTVHVANAKAAYPGRGNTGSAAQLTIDPGPRTLDGPDQRKEFDTGAITFGALTTAVHLGEIRTDDDGHLLVLGGHGAAASPTNNPSGSWWGRPEWYDDVSDGSVTATIKLRADASTPPVAGSWVIVAPPKFAPHQDSVTTLYDRLLEQMIALGLATQPATTSYTRDIQPILQRARDINWVRGVVASKHAWADPVTDQTLIDKIALKLRPAGSMPMLTEATDSSSFTPTQRLHLDRWIAATYVNDWIGVPGPMPLTPDGMDRAALDACVGAAFYPGIEAGGLNAADRAILNLAYVAPFRLAPATTPGAVTASMALPWQADFGACDGSWWPVPRPESVLPEGATAFQSWTRHTGGDMVGKWHTLGFVVKQGAKHVEVGSTQDPSITLMTPALRFRDTPQGPMGMVREVPLAISFEVVAPTTAVTLEYAPGAAPSHVQLVAITPSVTVAPTGPNAVATARLWIIYRTGTTGSAIPTETVTVRQAGTSNSWQIKIDANTIARRTAAVELVLDRSGSMTDDRGDGQPKHAALRDAANAFVDLMLEGDGIGITRFNEDAQEMQAVMKLGGGGIGDTNRAVTHAVIGGTGLDPAGATSIGDGIFVGRGALDAAGGFDTKALVVLTDGIENSPRSIADASGPINEKTYAVGFGMPQNISVPALQTLAGNNGGYVLVTGSITSDNRFRLQKHFLQILAGINNADVILDPDGVLDRGDVVRIPFEVSDADSGIEVVLLTPRPGAVDFRLQTPTGRLIEPWLARSEPTMAFELGDGLAYYRLSLPAQLFPGRFEQSGVWHAVLTIGRPVIDPPDAERVLEPRDGRLSLSPNPFEAQRAHAVAVEESMNLQEAGPDTIAATAGRGILPFSLVVNTYSSVGFDVRLEQSSREPGATVTLRARITQSGLPAEDGAAIWAEILQPDETTTTLALEPSGDGGFSASFVADRPGVYPARVRARGRTRQGNPFARERTLTAAVWHGGDVATPPMTGDTGGAGGCLCEALRCMLENGLIGDRLRERLREEGLDLDVALHCLDRHHDRPESEQR